MNNTKKIYLQEGYPYTEKEWDDTHELFKELDFQGLTPPLLVPRVDGSTSIHRQNAYLKDEIINGYYYGTRESYTPEYKQILYKLIEKSRKEVNNNVQNANKLEKLQKFEEFIKKYYVEILNINNGGSKKSPPKKKASSPPKKKALSPPKKKASSPPKKKASSPPKKTK